MLQTEGKDLIQGSKTLRDAFEKGIEKGIEKGRKEGIEEMLRRLFMRRLGRALTEREQQALITRAELGRGRGPCPRPRGRGARPLAPRPQCKIVTRRRGAIPGMRSPADSSTSTRPSHIPATIR